MQWRIQELTEGGAKGGSGGLAHVTYVVQTGAIMIRKNRIA